MLLSGVGSNLTFGGRGESVQDVGVILIIIEVYGYMHVPLINITPIVCTLRSITLVVIDL